MSKKQSVDLRAVADIKVAEWRKLHDEAEARNAEVAADVKARGLYSESLERIKLELKHVEARNAEAIVEREAVVALNAAELAEGLEDARTRDLPTLRTDLVDLFADVDRIQRDLDEARNRIHARVQAAQRAEGATKARREAAGLPFVGSGFAPNPMKRYVDSVDDAIARGIQSSHFGGEVKRLQALLISTAASLEQERIANEAKAKQKKWERDMDQRKADDIQRRARERAKEQNDAVEAEERRLDELARNYLARVGGV